MTEPRAMVDIVVGEARAHQFLEQIGFFVRAFGGAESGERTIAIALADAPQARGGAIERLFPARFAEMAPWIGRIDIIIRPLADAVLADQRLGQPLRMMDVV